MSRDKTNEEIERVRNMEVVGEEVAGLMDKSITKLEAMLDEIGQNQKLVKRLKDKLDATSVAGIPTFVEITPEEAKLMTSLLDPEL